MNYEKDLQRALSNQDKNKKISKQLQKTKPRELDNKIHHLHDQVFEKIDCLQCANCCKTTSPIFRDVDIKRIAKHLRSTETEFIDKYLKIDEDADYVLKSSPCQFLQEDNKCSIYDFRPKACQEYPHTNRKNMYQIMDLTYKNSLICPAVARIFDVLIS